MKLTWDEPRRQRTLTNRGLDFTDANQVIDGTSLTFPDDRRDYGEQRLITVGFLRGRMTLVFWTPRQDTRHIISMRRANEREQKRYQDRLG